MHSDNKNTFKNHQYTNTITTQILHLKVISKSCAQTLVNINNINKQYCTFKKNSNNKNALKNHHYTNAIITHILHLKPFCNKMCSRKQLIYLSLKAIMQKHIQYTVYTVNIVNKLCNTIHSVEY